MSGNRPLFDDEDLPEWLIQGGIAPAGRSAGGTSGTDDLAWLDEVTPGVEGEPLPWEVPGEVTPLPGAEPGADTQQLPWDSAEPLVPAIPEAALPSEAPDAGPLPWQTISDLPDQPMSAEPFADAAPPWAMTDTTHGESSTVLNLPWTPPDSMDDALTATPVWEPGVEWVAPAPAEAERSSPELVTPLPPAEESLPWADEPDSDDALDWLLPPDAAASVGAVAAAPPPAQTDWLRDFSLDDETPAEPEITPASEPVVPAARELEDWTAFAAESFGELELPDVESLFVPEPETESPPEPASEDDWLGSFAAPQAPGEAAPIEHADSLETLAVPDTFDMPTDAQVPLAESLAPGEGIPDWFREMAGVPSLTAADTADGGAVPPAEQQSADEVEALDWMAELPPGFDSVPEPEVSAAQPEQPAAEMRAEGEADALDWMSEVAEAPGVALPDWMQSESSDEGAEASLMAEEADIPEWMRGLAPVEESLAAASVVTPSDDVETEQALDWLAEIEETGALDMAPMAAPAVPSSIPTPEPAVPVETDALDLDLGASSLDIDRLLNLPPSEPIPDDSALTAPEFVDLEAPLDLDEIFGPESAPPEPAPETPVTGLAELVPPSPPPAPPPQQKGAPLPAWVSDMRPSDEPVVLRIGDQKIRMEESPAAGLDPMLRQLRERSHEVAAQGSGGSPPPAGGPLSGISGAIVPAAGALPGKATGLRGVAGLIVSDMQARRVKMLENLLTTQEELLRQQMARSDEEIEARAQSAVFRRTRARFKPDRLLVTLLLVLVIVAPFFTDATNLFSMPNAAALTGAPRARLESVGAAVDAIGGAQLDAAPFALVAFEYGPTASGELDDLARAVLRDLVGRGVRPVVVSTYPSGAIHAYGIMAGLGRDRLLTMREDYVMLGYLPGGAAGVRALISALHEPGLQRQFVFGTDIEGRPAALDEAALDSLRTNPAFLLAETQDDVRNWAEQFRVPGTGEGLPLVLLTTASASPAAAAYSQEGRITGPLVGLRDALLYQEARGLFATAEAERVAAQRWQSTGLGALLAAVTILIGAALNMIRSLRRRNRR
jgi:hypothetical protein